MDSTALQRQNRRIGRLKEMGVDRTTVLVHRDCKKALEGLRPHLVDPVRADALNALVEQLHNKQKPTNVAQVRQLSPFRYPGGKTWLVPEVRKWLMTSKRQPSVFVEPFAGGAMSGLTVAAESLAEHVVLAELDDDVAAVWQTIFAGRDADVRWLCNRITGFDVTLENVRKVLDGKPSSTKEWAWRTIIKNRMQRGGIMSAGAGLVKEGEAGRGLKSRWYPETLATRIEVLRSMRERVTFEHADAFAVIQAFADDTNAFFFVEAWGFMSRAALMTQSMDHHPEWTNIYGRVEVTLATHSAGGVTEKDIELARRIEAQMRRPEEVRQTFTPQTPALQALRMRLHAQHQPVVLMRTDCHVCRAEGLAPRSQVLIIAGDRTVQALLYQIDSDLLKTDG